MSTPLKTASHSLPRKRASLTIRPADAPGRYVVKDSTTNAFFQIGEEEFFLLSQLMGPNTKANLRREFAKRFGAPLSSGDLTDFIENGLKYGLLDDGTTPLDSTQRPNRRLKGENPLYFRYRLFDPDRILSRIEPAIRFVWTIEFVVASLLLIATAAIVAIANRGEWVSMFPDKLTWQTAALTFFFILVATLFHEFAHGLTCKHFGGKVHEIGAMMILFMPCMYCNVSDAWLFRERWKRIAVGIAGTFLDMIAWALMTLLWRATDQDSFVNYAAWLLSSVCLGRTFFNLTPLLKLDGYYVLSDWLRVPNLSSDGPERLRNTVQWFLWGSPRPKPHPKGTVLLAWGAANWLFMCFFLYAIVVSFFAIDAGPLTIFKTVFSAYAGFMIGKSVLKVFFSREIFRMLRSRPRHTLAWVGGFAGLAFVLMIPVQDRAVGTFSVRPATHIDVVATEAGFLQQIKLNEGDSVASGATIAAIRLPSLESEIAGAEALVREAFAELRRISVGPRPEEIQQQQDAVAQADQWLDRARRQLEVARLSHQQQLVRLDYRIARADLVAKQANATADYSRKLVQVQALTGHQQRQNEQHAAMSALEADRMKSVKSQRETIAYAEQEAEVVRRQRALADEESKLRLLSLGGRSEDIEAQKSQLRQLEQQLELLKQTRQRLAIAAPVSGLIITSHLCEQNGKFVQQGELICVIEESKSVLAEIAIPERRQHRIEVGQQVELRPFAMSTEIIATTVERKAPSVTESIIESTSMVTVYCRLATNDATILSGTTGAARVYLGRRPIGAIIAGRIASFAQTQIWHW